MSTVALLRQRIIRLLSLSGLALTVIAILLLSLALVLLGTGSGSRWVMTRISAAMTTESSSLSIGRIEGTLLRGLSLQDIAYRDGTNHITIGSLQSDWNLLSLLSGQLTLETLHADGLDIHWLTAATGNPAPASAPADPFAGLIPLPVALRINNAELSHISIHLDDQTLQIQSLDFAAILNADVLDMSSLQARLSLPENADSLSGRIREISLTAELNLTLTPTLPLSGNLAWQVTGPLSETIDSASGLLEFNGDLQVLELNHQLYLPMALHSAGELRLNTQLDAPTEHPPELQLRHTLQQENLPLPGLEELRLQHLYMNTYGQLDALILELSTSVSLPWLTPTQLTLQSQLHADRLDLSALRLSNGGTTLDISGQLDWAQALKADIGFTLDSDESTRYLAALLPELPAGITLGDLSSAGQLQLHSNEGQIEGSFRLDRLSGQLNAYPITGNADIVFNNTTLSINTLHLASAGNLLDIQGSIGNDARLGEVIALDFNLQAPDLATLNPEARGNFHASGNISGTAETPQITLDSTAGNIEWGNFRIGSFNATGAYANNSNQLGFSLQDASFSTAAEQVNISSMQGQLSGLPEAHDIQLSISSSLADLDMTAQGRFTGQEWQGLIHQASVRSDFGSWGLQKTVDLSVSADRFSASQQCWQTDDGIPGQLCLQADWQTDDGFAVVASLDDYPLAVLNTPAAIARLASLETAPRAYPQLHLPWYLPESTALSGPINASLTLSGAASVSPREWDLALDITTGENILFLSTSNQEAETGLSDEQQTGTGIEQLSWSNASMTARQRDGEWQLQASLDFQQQNLGATNTGMQGSLNANAGMNRDQQLSGQLALAMAELTFVEAFLPQLRNVQGQLDGLVDIGGSLAQPEFTGELRLQQAAAELPALGLSLTDIQATLNADGGIAGAGSTDSYRLTLTAAAGSGNGTLNLHSVISDPLSQERQLNMTLQGSNFQLADLSELALQISPDLLITASSAGITVNGQLLLPQLNIVLDSLPESAVDVSGDTVLVGTPASGEEVHNAAQTERGMLADIPVHGEIQLTLGEDVHFSGFGLNTGLQGSLEINQRGTSTPLAYGELSIVDGSYVTYGQRLDIEHGKLLFFGSMDNPGLDIRATRQTDTVKAGIQMNGTLRDIRSQLFSTPSLPDSDIIAVLVTGRPFSEIGNQQDGNALIGAIATLGINQGQSLTNQVRNQLGLDTLTISSRGDTTDSSLMLGKYITPDIFVRYAVGLFETESVLAIDYSISERIKLEATSGQGQSIDVTYTLQR